MHDQVVCVECYSGYRADERPLRLKLKDRAREVVAVEDRWYSPGATYFRVLLDDGDRYLLRHEEAQDVWRIAGYRAGGSNHPGWQQAPDRLTDVVSCRRKPSGGGA